jgi:hypothetical protein
VKDTFELAPMKVTRMPRTSMIQNAMHWAGAERGICESKDG